MLITKEWLQSKAACKAGHEWSLKQEGIDKGIDVFNFLELLVKENHWSWTNWVIIRVMRKSQYLKYAIFSAEQVIGIYEKMYPDNDKAHKAIEAARKVLENDTKENRVAAAYAAKDTYAAAAYAAYAAAYSIYEAADSAVYAAVYADDDNSNKIFIKIINYGIKLLKEGEN